MAHAEAAVLQRASSVEATPRDDTTAVGVGRKPAQGGRQTRTAAMLAVVKLTTTVYLLQLYKNDDNSLLATQQDNTTLLSSLLYCPHQYC